MKKLTLKDVAQILCTNPITIKLHAEKGHLPKLESDGEDLFMSQETLEKHFDLENLDEPFMDIHQVMSEVNLPRESITNAARNNELNSYRLSNKRGSKVLYRKSDIAEWLKLEFVASMTGSQKMYKYLKMLNFFHHILSVTKKSELISHKEHDLLKLVFIEGEALAKASEKIGISKKRGKVCIEHGIKRLEKNIYKLNDFYQTYLKLRLDNKKLHSENKFLKKQIEEIVSENNEFRKKSNMKPLEKIVYDDNPNKYLTIEDLDISARLYDTLKAAKLDTVDIIIENSLNDLLKLRNFGKRNIVELEDILEGLKLSLAND